MSPVIEVAIPCLNEAAAIGRVLQDFRRVLPSARLVVYDNSSTDGTGAVAQAAGADIRHVPRRGKGFVLQAILAQSCADVVLLVDGDGTYEAEDAPSLLQPVLAGAADMVMGNRLASAAPASFRRFHRLGNRILAGLLNALFGTSFHDVLSGYRAFGRRFLDGVPLVTAGFEIETEMVLRALELGLTIHEVPIRYRPRGAGSASKLRTFHDGSRILATLAILLRDHRPILVFGMASVVLALSGVGCWLMGVTGRPGLRPPGVVLTVSALVLYLAGVTLDAINSRFRETHTLLQRQVRGRELL